MVLRPFQDAIVFEDDFLIDFGRLVCRLGGLLGRLEASRSRLGLRLGPLLAPKMESKTDPRRGENWMHDPLSRQLVPRPLQEPPRPPKSAPRPPQEAQNDPQDGQKRPQTTPKTIKTDPRRPPRLYKTRQDKIRQGQDETRPRQYMRRQKEIRDEKRRAETRREEKTKTETKMYLYCICLSLI